MAVTKVVMPKLSEAMETGKIIKWVKQEGDRIQGGDILAEVETDKADVEMEAFGAGVLRKILVPAGSQVPVGSLIAVVAEPGDDVVGAAGRGRGSSPVVPRRPRRPVPRLNAGPSRAAGRAGGRAPRYPDGRRHSGARRIQPAPRAAPALVPVAASPSHIRGPRKGLPAWPGRSRPSGAWTSATCRAAGLVVASSVGTSRRRRAPLRRRAPAAIGAEFEDHPDVGHPRCHRSAHAALQGSGPALLREQRGRHGPRVGVARGAERARRATERSPSTTSSSAPAPWR